MDWQETVIQHRRQLHQIPELGFRESQTSAYLYSALTELGLQPKRITETGMIADIPGRAPGRCVALRADIDALPLTEQTGLPFVSQHPGAMHACGHDGHMAMLLTCATRLVQDRSFSGTVRLLFQPAEEQPPGGAPEMIAHGCLDGVEEIYGLHVWPQYPVGTVALRPGAMMAYSDKFRIIVQGRGGHGSEPRDTRDAVLIASQIVVNLQTIVSRRISAFEPAVLTCGTIHSGVNFNIIAETAEISGTVRTLSREVQDRIEEEMRQIIEHTAQLNGAHAILEYERSYPAVMNHPGAVKRWSRAHIMPTSTDSGRTRIVGDLDGAITARDARRAHHYTSHATSTSPVALPGRGIGWPVSRTSSR
jgi:amidohydrolase